MESEPLSMDFLICGGANDPNILCLESAAKRLEVKHCLVLHSKTKELEFTLDYQAAQLTIDGKALRPRGAFVRYDVFGASNVAENGLDRSYGWFSSCMGAIASFPNVRIHNIRMDLRANHKSFMLAHARDHGLKIPKTIISNSKLDVLGLSLIHI